MNGQIDLILQKSLFDLFHEQSLDARRELGEGCSKHLITRCADHFDAHFKFGMVALEQLLKEL